MEKLLEMVVRCEVWPTGLVGADVIAKEYGLSEDRVIGLADSGYMPHYRLDGGTPMFKKSDAKHWIAQNMMQQIKGKAADFEFKVFADIAQRFDTLPPKSISNITGLTELTHMLYPSGVYFLVQDDEVVYVGQSINPLSRISTHIKEKAGKFDKSYFLAVPKHMLDAVEGGFINLLNPKLNEGRAPKPHGKEKLANEIHPTLYNLDYVRT